MKQISLIFLLFIGIVNAGLSQTTNTFPTTGNAGVGTTSPTHSLTLGSTATGIALYNTTDQTTNYERALNYWNSGVYTIQTQSGGTGTTRAIQFGIGLTTTLNRLISIANVSSKSGVIQLNFGTISSSTSGAGTLGTFNASTTVIQNAYAIVPTVTQSNAAGYRALWISPFESTSGTGAHYLIDAGTNTDVGGNGTHTSVFRLDDVGATYIANSLAINTTNAYTYKLAVNGGIIATAITVKLFANWPDYVFKKQYKLPALSDVKNYIDKNSHLPELPSEADVAKDGINLGEMNKLLVKKVEELTLYMIAKDQKEKEQDQRINNLEKELQKLKQTK